MLYGLLAAVLVAAAGTDSTMVAGHHIERQLALDGTRLHTTAIHNTHAAEPIAVAGPEFVLTHGAGETVTSDAFTTTALEESADATRAVLHHDGLQLRAMIDYIAAPAGSWLYKQITFTNQGNEPFLLRTVELEHIQVANEAVTYAVDPQFPALGDWGQPVYTESLWFGVEFPASRASAAADGVIFLRHHPGTTLAPGESYTTKRAVLGAARPGAVKEAFLDYIATITPFENPPRANIYWNGFRVIKPPNRTDQGLAMIEYARKLREQTGFTFNGWTYDAGFDMYRPDALFVPNEAHIWPRTREKLEEIDTPLGFWTSFSPIFDTPTHAWGKTQGFELQHDASYCLAGPTYYQAIRARLEEIVRTHDMNTINFDGMYWGQGFGCNQPGHGHLVGEGHEAGVYSLEKVVENKRAIFESLRQINPDIVLDLFVCGEWASPWWLMQLDGVHTVPGDTVGCDIPSPWLRDELITVRDIQVFEEHRRTRRQFPLWAEDLYGTQVRSDHLIDGITVTGEAMAKRWEDEYVMALAGRGAVANSIMCSDLGVLDESAGGLRFLGEVGNWVRRNVAIYQHFRLLGGEPVRREPYGYAHGNGAGRSIVALRNPWIEPATYQLVVDDTLGLGESTGPCFVNVVYPYRETFGPVARGERVPILLRDYDVLLLEVRSEARQFADLPDIGRWTLKDDGTVAALDTTPLKQLPDGSLQQSATKNGLELTGRVAVPETCDGGTLQVMVYPGSGPVQQPAAFVNGTEAPLAFHHRTRRTGEDAWALVEVPPGAHDVRLVLPAFGTGRIGAWLRADYTLKPANKESEAMPAGDFFPVYAPDKDRRIATLLPATYATRAMPPVPKGDTVGIAALRERCLVSKVGFFDVGWDASCWPDDRVLRIGDATYEHGLGVHAPAEMVFDIEGAFTRFTAMVGLHGIPPERKNPDGRPGTCAFIVEGDGTVLYESPVRREGDPPLPITVDISGVNVLTLRVTDGGDSNYDDLATWGDARLSR